MGSRITRAMTQTQRQRRVPASQQGQAKQFIKILCTSLTSIIYFAMGFMTSHSAEAHSSCMQSLVVSMMCSIFLNAVGPQPILVCGWVLIMVWAIVNTAAIRILYTIGSIMVLYSTFTNLYNYYQIKTTKPFMKYIVASTLMIIGACLLRIAHCSSHYIKQLRSQTVGLNIQQQHSIGLRVLFSILGLMVVMLLLMGHVYIRKYKFVMLTLNQQWQYLSNIKLITIIKFIMLICAFRYTVLSVQLTRMCKTNVPLMVDLVLLCGSVGVFAKLTYVYVISNSNNNDTINNNNTNSNSSIGGNILCDNSNTLLNKQNLLTLRTLILYNICIYSNIHLYLSYLCASLLSLLLIMHLSTIIGNQHRINYIIAFIVAIIAQTNKMQHMHSYQHSNYYPLYANVAVVAATSAIPIWRQLRNRVNGYRMVRINSADIENI